MPVNVSSEAMDDDEITDMVADKLMKMKYWVITWENLELKDHVHSVIDHVLSEVEGIKGFTESLNMRSEFSLSFKDYL